MSSRTRHQQRNHAQRRKLARAPIKARMLFQSTRDFIDEKTKKLVRTVRSFRRKV